MAATAELSISPAACSASPPNSSSHTRNGFGFLGTFRVERLSPNCSLMTAGVTEDVTPVESLSSFTETNPDPLSCPWELADELIDSLAFEIQECSHARDRASGQQVHAHIICCGLDADRYLGNLLILMYGNCASTEAAEAVFHNIPNPNIYSSNILINAFAKNDHLDKAKIVFTRMPRRNAASWNAIISALAKNGDSKDALQYYHNMLVGGFMPDVITFVSVIDACADAMSLNKGMQLHSLVVELGHVSDIIVGTALVNMYGQCGSLDSAREVFRHLPQHDVLSWSAMMAACVENGCYQEALDMFDQMQLRGFKPSRSTYLTSLDACGNLSSLRKGYEMHACMLGDDLDSDIIVENALIDMFGKCKSLSDSIVAFSKMLQRNIISWSTMIAAYAGNQKNEKAIQLFYQMQEECINPNSFTFSIVLDACASTKALKEGQYIHDYVVCCGVEIDKRLAISLIEMYGDCGRLDDAWAVFCDYEDQGVSIWNTIISACVVNGYEHSAWMLFKGMQSKGVKPDQATFKIVDGLGHAAVDRGSA